MRTLGTLVVVSALIGAACEGAAAPTPAPTQCRARELAFSRSVDITGAWRADGGGLYFIRQQGDEIVWVGMSGLGDPPAEIGRDYTNAFHGTREGVTITGSSTDVPRGKILNHFDLTLEIVDQGGQTQIKLVESRAPGYGDKLFRPCTPL